MRTPHLSHTDASVACICFMQMFQSPAFVSCRRLSRLHLSHADVSDRPQIINDLRLRSGNRISRPHIVYKQPSANKFAAVCLYTMRLPESCSVVIELLIHTSGSGLPPSFTPSASSCSRIPFSLRKFWKRLKSLFGFKICVAKRFFDARSFYNEGVCLFLRTSRL